MRLLQPLNNLVLRTKKMQLALLLLSLIVATMTLSASSTLLNADAAQTTSSIMNPTAAWSSDDTDDTYSIAWGDVDLDGDLDLAVGNYETSNKLYLNNGGMLQTNANWLSDEKDGTADVKWGDVNGDGYLDLAVGNVGAPNRLYLNKNGILETTASWNSSDSDRTYSVDWGDIDDDGDLDLAAGNYGQSNKIYFNIHGSLETRAGQLIGSDEPTRSVAWGDVNNDGKLDLAIGNEGEPSTVHLNIRTGLEETPSWNSRGNDYTKEVAWGDVNGDGFLDLAAGNDYPSNKLYLNNRGSLQTNASNPWASNTDCTTSVAWGDMDNDGDLDLAIANRLCGFSGTKNIVHVNNNGELQLEAVWESDDQDFTNSIAWGDVDGDGDLDLAVGNDGGRNKLYINEGIHFDSTNDMVWPSTDEFCTYSLAWGDVDSDNDLDLAVGNIICEDGGSNKLYTNSNGRLSATANWTSRDGSETYSLAWGDIDGDSDLDLAAGNADNPNKIYRNEGGYLTTTAVWDSFETDDTRSVAWGDVDGDGDLDLAAGNWNSTNRLYRNIDGTLTETSVWQTIDEDPTSSLAWSDVDGDGDVDLAVGNYGKNNKIYFNIGGSLQPEAGWYSGDNDSTTGVAWGDVDGDGDLDLVAGNRYSPNKVYLNEGGNLQTVDDNPWISNDDAGTDSTAWADIDTDGDLDLTFANWDEPNVLHFNHNGTLGPKSEMPESERFINAIAWGDLDGDGDLDAALGSEGFGSNLGNLNGIYINMRRQWMTNWDNPVHIRLQRPGNTDDAAFFSTPQILRASNITIEYTMVDREGDDVVKILPEYSPNGGGQWFSATPGPGGDGLTNLSASSRGTDHTFVWNAEADLIKSENVVFRISAIPERKQSPIHWAAQAAQSPPFRVEAARWFVKVVDEDNQAVEGALLFQGGARVMNGTGFTDRAGLLRLEEPMAGETLIGLKQVFEQPTSRKGHDGWAYRVFITNLNLDDEGTPHPDMVDENRREQKVTLSRENPLILFNIIVSIEWDADEAYLDSIGRAFESASDYLYDVTDGQMAFVEVKIFDKGEHWADADFQISTKNTVRPYAYVGGIISEDTAHAIRVGRFWDGESGNQGTWEGPNGYRTLIHEFGHYALNLYDEYYVRTVDGQGHFTGQKNSACTDLDIVGTDDTPTNASIMYYQYNASELADDDRWSTPCKNTEQDRVNGESDWATVVRQYSDKNSTPRWSIMRPKNRGSVMGGPGSFPGYILPFPEITIDPESRTGESPRKVTVLGQDKAGFPNALVALYTTPGEYTIAIDQGLTDQFGRLAVYGALEDDTIQVASLDGAYAGAAVVDESNSYQIILGPTGPSTLQSANNFSTPYLHLIPESDGDSLFLEVHGAPRGSVPLNAVVTPDPGVGSPQSTSLAYSSSKGIYTGGVSFAGVGLGSGEVRVSGSPDGQWLSINANYNLLWVGNNQNNELASEDGNLQLYVDPGSLPSAEAYATVLPTGYVPAPLPDGQQVLASAYNVRFSGAMTGFEKPALLKLIYHPDVVGMAKNLTIYHWNAEQKRWQVMGGKANSVENGLTVPITQLGIYVLGGKIEAVPVRILLPVIASHS